MIVFEKIRWKNFLSTGNVFTEVDLCSKATTLVVGKNGHGKSTMLDALTFALFGKPFRKINKPNLVNSINQKDCLVELEFRVGVKKYFIRRGISPNIFEIRIDGQLVDQEAISKDYQTHLENTMLKFNHRAFTQIVILGSKSFIPFMKLKAEDRRLIIENLLDIEIFSSMNKVAKEFFTAAKEALAANKNLLESTKAQIELQKKYVADAQKNNQEAIKALEEEIYERKEKIDTYQAVIEEFDRKIDDLRNKALERITAEGKRQLIEKTLTTLENKISKCNHDLDFYGKNESCPTCRQEMSREMRDKVIAEATAKRTEYSDMKISAKKHKTKIDAKLLEIMKIEDQIATFKRQKASHLSSIETTREFIVQTEKKIEDLKTKRVISDDMVDTSNKLIDTLKTANEKRAEILEDRAYYEVAVNLLKDGGIKAQIIKQYLPVINNLVNKYLASMDFFVNFELNEEFEETIKSRHRDQFTYDSFSEGEKQKIDIALLFAWRAVAKLKNSMNTNLLILDEIFDSSLDGAGADLVLQMLSALPSGSNVFVISHRELLHDKFDSTIRFEKRNSFSEIVDLEE
jgi:DNA repair exonuclease SbcCD ATPase subunit